MPGPYQQRIQQQKQRIRQHSGDDSQMRDRLNQIRAKRAGGNKPQQPTPTPWNAQYESSVGSANQLYDQQEPAFTAQEQSLEKAYGFNDSSDPFSRATQLQAQFANANRGTGNNYAAAGQLYAGSLSNARNIDRNNFDQAWDTSQKELQSKLYDVGQQRLAAQQAQQQSILAAEAQRLEDAVAEPVDPAEAPPQGKKKNNGGKKSKGRK